MRHVLLDTNVLADFFAGDPDTVEAFQRSRTLAINTVVLGELLAGFATGSRPEANRQLLARFLFHPSGKHSAVGSRDCRALRGCLLPTTPKR